MEKAFAADAQLRRPRPDIASLRAAEPALRSIVTAPPGAGRSAPAAATSAV
jgi:hypothetical protein